MHACDPAIVYLHSPAHRFRGIPYLDFQSGACTFCGACVEACPVEREDEVPASLGTVLLDRNQCIAWNGVICLSCQTACTYRSVTMDLRGRPAITTEACTGCGACVGVCPSQALQVPAPVFEPSEEG